MGCGMRYSSKILNIQKIFHFKYSKQSTYLSRGRDCSRMAVERDEMQEPYLVVELEK